MKPSAPKKITWYIALILGVLALLGHLAVVSALTPYAFWLAAIGLGLMLIATITKGL